MKKQEHFLLQHKRVKQAYSMLFSKKIHAIGTVPDDHEFSVGALPPDSHKFINLPSITNHITQNIVYNSWQL